MKVDYNDSFDPADAAFTLFLAEPLSNGQLDRLRSVITSWFVLGSYGVFGVPLSYLSEISIDTEEKRPAVQWVLDMAGAGEEVVDVLVRALEAYAQLEGVRFERLLLGWRDD